MSIASSKSHQKRGRGEEAETRGNVVVGNVYDMGNVGGSMPWLFSNAWHVCAYALRVALSCSNLSTLSSSSRWYCSFRMRDLRAAMVFCRLFASINSCSVGLGGSTMFSSSSWSTYLPMTDAIPGQQ